MGFMDKLKQTATSAKDSMKKSFDETSAAMKAHNEESKELKKALDGAIARYEVTYVGGLPEIPKRKSGAIGLNIMPDKFSFRPTITTKEWFSDYDIPYNKISELRIEKRTISTTEVLLGGGDSANQEQENVICILYTSQDNKKLTLRVEMLTGTQFLIRLQSAVNLWICLDSMIFLTNLTAKIIKQILHRMEMMCLHN